MLGASAVQLGTAFLSCPQASVHPRHRQALTEGARATLVTAAFTGRPARALANRYAAARGSSEFMAMWAGQAYRLNRAMPAAELVATLAREAMARIASAV